MKKLSKIQMEYERDLNAFEQLYHEIKTRYESLSLRDDFFEMDFMHKSCSLNSFIGENKRDTIRIPREVMDFGLWLLLNMEKNLNRISTD